MIFSPFTEGRHNINKGSKIENLGKKGKQFKLQWQEQTYINLSESFTYLKRNRSTPTFMSYNWIQILWAGLLTRYLLLLLQHHLWSYPCHSFPAVLYAKTHEHVHQEKKNRGGQVAHLESKLWAMGLPV